MVSRHPISIYLYVCVRHSLDGPSYLAVQYPDSAEIITENLLKLTELAPNPCVYPIYGI
jgi:hypothetical protein